MARREVEEVAATTVGKKEAKEVKVEVKAEVKAEVEVTTVAKREVEEKEAKEAEAEVKATTAKKRDVKEVKATVKKKAVKATTVVKKRVALHKKAALHKARKEMEDHGSNCQCPPSKWYCRAPHLGDLTNHTPAMLIDAYHHYPYIKDTLWPFALRLAYEQDWIYLARPTICPPLKSSWAFPSGPALLIFTSIWKPHLCSLISFVGWQIPTKMGWSCSGWLLPWKVSSVHLILHPTTGHVSPQFHCVFNDNFETLTNLLQSKHLWPTHVIGDSDYANTNFPTNLDAPWFLQTVNEDDSSSDATSVDKREQQIENQSIPDPPEPEYPHPRNSKTHQLLNHLQQEQTRETTLTVPTVPLHISKHARDTVSK